MMTAIDYTYTAPETADEALALLYENDARVIVSLRHIEEFKTIEVNEAGSLTIGSLVTLAELMQHSATAGYPALAQSLATISDRHILNNNTVGDALNANDIELAAVTASLLALDTDVVVVEYDMDQEYPFSDFLETDLSRNELLAFVRIVLPDDSTSAYENANFLSGNKPVCGVAIGRESATNEVLRIVLAGCVARPLRLQSIENALAGKDVNDSTIEAALKQISDETLVLRNDLPIGEDYLRHLIKVLVRKAILKL